MTPEQEEAVRRALGAAARDEVAGESTRGGVPPEVAARLDRVLAELASPAGEVRARRRPRVLAIGAAAALAVVAGAAAVTGGLGSSSGTDSDAGRHGAVVRPSPAAPQRRALGADGAAGPLLHRATLRKDVQRLVDGLAAVPRQVERQPGCPEPPVRHGDLVVRVSLDGRPASLVLKEPAGGRREVAVYSCSDPRRPVRTTSAVVPAR